MKLSDYVIDYLADVIGVRHVFLIVGGANLHLADSIARHPRMELVAMQHEQAVAMAAEAYARGRNGLGVALVTSGPGGTNAITGVSGAWMDSTPCLFISGQVSTWDYVDGRTIRQLGVQQINIVDLVRPVTKYVALVDRPEAIRQHLDRSVHCATEGRPGPVWLDIPQNVQMAQIDPIALAPEARAPAPEAAIDALPRIVARLHAARRPVLIVGNGVRLAKGQQLLDTLIDRLGFPIITTWAALDLVADDHPLYVGRSGVFGQYGANFAVANADLVLSIGSRLDTRQTGTRRGTFARAATKIVVDVSKYELEKRLIEIDHAVCADAAAFMRQLLEATRGFRGADITDWVARCAEWKRRYPRTPPQYFDQQGSVNSYVFVDTLCDELSAGDVIVTDMGTSLSCTHQAFKVKRGQRLITNTGLAPMGFGLPAAIGAWYATGPERVVCLSGDGGLQMNIQEFQTLVQYGVPVKLFILNNREYVTIKHTQHAYFEGRIVGSDPASGYSAPDFVRVAEAYGLGTAVIRDHHRLRERIRDVLAQSGPVVCEVQMAADQPLVPILLQRRRANGTTVTDPIERLSPYLPEAEFRQNMIVPPLED